MPKKSRDSAAKKEGVKAEDIKSDETIAKPGDTVTVHYKGAFEDGAVFDSSEGREPLNFKIGEGHVIRGFEEAATGMGVNQEKKAIIEPQSGYGPRDERLVQKVPLKMFPPQLELKPGLGLRLQAPTGQLVTAIVTDVDNENATVDFNHPLAGKTLHFDIKLIAIN